MRRVFADTSALIALRDSGDSNHQAAVDWLNEALEQGDLKLVLTNYILAETHAFFCRAPQTAIAYAERLRADPLFEVLRATESDETHAWGLLNQSKDKAYSFVDAVSFALMHRLKLREALAFDAHFKQWGRVSVLP